MYGSSPKNPGYFLPSAFWFMTQWDDLLDEDEEEEEPRRHSRQKMLPL